MALTTPPSFQVEHRRAHRAGKYGDANGEGGANGVHTRDDDRARMSQVRIHGRGGQGVVTAAVEHSTS